MSNCPSKKSSDDKTFDGCKISDSINCSVAPITYLLDNLTLTGVSNVPIIALHRCLFSHAYKWVIVLCLCIFIHYKKKSVYPRLKLWLNDCKNVTNSVSHGYGNRGQMWCVKYVATALWAINHATCNCGDIHLAKVIVSFSGDYHVLK